MKVIYACILIIICTLVTTGFLGDEHIIESNMFQTTSAPDISGEKLNQTPPISNYPVDFDDTKRSKIVNNQDRPQNMTPFTETSNSQDNVLAEPDNEKKHIEIGVNYLSTYNAFSSNYTTDSVLRRDFSQFQHDGITVISLSLYWYRLEGNSRGNYNGTYPDGTFYGDKFLSDIKRVAMIANEYGIKVMITFHTVYGDGSDWCLPNYTIDPTTGKKDGFAIVRSDEMKQAFIDVVNHTVNYLSGTPNIYAWAILNEPWFYHDLDAPVGYFTQKEDFVDLIKKLSLVVKTLDGRPTTVRFVSAHALYH